MASKDPTRPEPIIAMFLDLVLICIAIRSKCLLWVKATVNFKVSHFLTLLIRPKQYVFTYISNNPLKRLYIS